MATKIKPILKKDINGAWSARAILQKPNGQLYNVSYHASPDMKLKQAKGRAVEGLDELLAQYAQSHPDWVRVNPEA